MSRLLVIDDDPVVRSSLKAGLGSHSVKTVSSGADGLRAASDERFDCILLDLGLPDRDGLEVLAELRRTGTGTPVVVISADQDMAATVRAMRDGAFDFVSKPFRPEDLEVRVKRALQLAAESVVAVRAKALPDERGAELIGSSDAMREVYKTLGLLAASRATVLIRGESGTGKELAARVLHRFGGDPALPYVPVNCSALPAPLVEAEIFGYKRGSFTGADRDRPGKLDAAGEGTLVLDEIGDVPPETQVKLLRVLQEREYSRLGETESRPFRARVIAVTHRDLEALVREGLFREDLYYRINVATVTIPPLRSRADDLPLIVQSLLSQISREVGRPVAGLSEGAMKVLEAHDWPGNVRELRNVLTRAAVRCRGETIVEENLEFGTSTQSDPGMRLPRLAAGAEPPLPTLAESERELVKRALERAEGHRGRACRILGISRPTLLRKMRRYGLD